VHKIIVPVLLFITISACVRINQFEKNIQIPESRWTYKFEPEVKFEIKDTNSLYNVFVTLRHKDAYAYRNLWLDIATRQPGDTSFQKGRFEMTLQQTDGKWLGTGYGDIWELRHPLFKQIQFKKQGEYTIRLRQIMRDDPLMHIMNAGIRIEKAS
jgi:gliding motility-associated lipoprotein GldH